MNDPVLPVRNEPPGCWLLLVSVIVSFAAGALAATAALTARGSMQAEASNHTTP